MTNNSDDKKIEFIQELIVDNKFDVILLLTAVFIGLYFKWSNMEIIIFVISISSILRPISSRLMAIPALFFLSLTPILLSLERTDRAEEFAVYAYYFLVMSVIMGIYEMKKDS